MRRQQVSNSVISTSSFHLLLIIFVSSTNCPSSLKDSEQIDHQDPFEEQPAIEKVQKWNRFQLRDWIQKRHPLEAKNLEKFEEAEISGKFFLTLAGDVDSFERKCHLPFGPSGELANLAREIAEGETKQGKLLSFIPYSKH